MGQELDREETHAWITHEDNGQEKGERERDSYAIYHYYRHSLSSWAYYRRYSAEHYWSTCAGLSRYWRPPQNYWAWRGVGRGAGPPWVWSTGRSWVWTQRRGRCLLRRKMRRWRREFWELCRRWRKWKIWQVLPILREGGR